MDRKVIFNALLHVILVANQRFCTFFSKTWWLYGSTTNLTSKYSSLLWKM